MTPPVVLVELTQSSAATKDEIAKRLALLQDRFEQGKLQMVSHSFGPAIGWCVFLKYDGSPFTLNRFFKLKTLKQTKATKNKRSKSL